jgi:hypothetical protein
MATEALPVKLTDDEVLTRTRELIDALNAEDDLADKLARFKEDHKEQVAVAGADTKRLRRIVSTRTEYRDVEVVESHDYKRGVVDIVRADTHETIRTRAMTESERQSPLFDAEDRARQKAERA